MGEGSRAWDHPYTSRPLGPGSEVLGTRKLLGLLGFLGRITRILGFRTKDHDIRILLLSTRILLRFLDLDLRFGFGFGFRFDFDFDSISAGFGLISACLEL